jgi:dCMP deaminase
MGAARLNASMSTCITRRVGAIACKGSTTIGAGWNGNIPGAVTCLDGGCQRCSSNPASGTGLATCVCVHAEAMLVATAARYGTSLRDADIFVTTHPCLECVKLLSFAGISQVVFDEPYGNTYSTDAFIMRQYHYSDGIDK